jgi:hypothetical protein
MIEQGAASAVLVYEGVPIRRRDEKLNLTDMWRAAGADDSKRPARWCDLPSVQEFCDHIAGTIGFSDSEVFHVVRGGSEPATYAHWQLGLDNTPVGLIIEAERGRDGGTLAHQLLSIHPRPS